MKKTLAILALFGLTGCASIIEGSTQEITINTVPPGAHCTVQREGADIATISETPDTRVYKRTKHNMVVVCNHDDCNESKFPLESGTSGGTWGNILLGGGIGWAVDSAAGADNEYPKRADIVMDCPPPPAPEPVKSTGKKSK